MAAVLAGGAATSAHAYGFLSNADVPAGYTYIADTDWAQATTSVNGSSDHTWCPATTQGARGWNQSWSYLSYSACGTGYQYQAFCACLSTRGTVYNPNVSTTDHIDSANWYW